MILLGLLTLQAQPGRAMDEEDAPESVEIDTLSHLYGPVDFDHKAHVAMADCSDCHHHTTGTKQIDDNCIRCHATNGEADTVACSECHDAHPFSAGGLKRMENPDLYHIDKPGLKGAYHVNCVGCHKEMEAPSGCQDCHKMTEAGEKQFNTGKFAPAGSGHDEKEGH